MQSSNRSISNSINSSKRIAIPLAIVILFFSVYSVLDHTVAAANNQYEPTAGVTYYVNANTGSDGNSGYSTSSAFRTLNHAVSKTNPGDTVLVMNGTYREEGNSTATLTVDRAGTADNWITYKAYPGHSPIIQSNGAWQAVRLESRYIIVDGFRVRGIRDQVSFAEAEQAFNDYRYNNAGMQKRIHGSGITLSSFNIIRNNEVWNFGGGGIEAIRVDSVIIENNRVHDTSHYSPFGHSGISIIYAGNTDGTLVGLEGDKYKIIVRGNIAHNNLNLFPCGCYDYRSVTDGNGIIIDDLGNYNGWTLVANNLVFNNGGSGIHTYLARNVDIINNTAYKNAQSEDIQGDLYSRRSENINLINNIIYARTGEAVTTDNPGINVNYSYNIYYDGTNSPYVPGGLGTGDIIADPQFINPGFDPNNIDFRLSPNSVGLDSGSGAYLPMTDIRGALRPQGSTDRGAYENTSAPVQPTPTSPTQPTPAPTTAPTPVSSTQPTQSSVAQPISPDGQAAVDPLTFVWNNASDAATYRLFSWNVDTRSIALNKVYRMDEISCDANRCRVDAPVALGTGNFYWVVQTRSNNGAETWSNRKDFSISSNSSTPVEVAQPISPSGQTSANQPTFVWSNASDAASYRLFSWNVDTNNIALNKVYRADEIACDASRCRVVAPAMLGTGNFYWVVQTRSNSGTETWSVRMDFSNNQVTAAAIQPHLLINEFVIPATEVEFPVQIYLPLME